MNSHLRPYNRCISNISTNIYLGLDFIIKINGGKYEIYFITWFRTK